MMGDSARSSFGRPKHPGLYNAPDPKAARHQLGDAFNELSRLEKRLGEGDLDTVSRANILDRIDELETLIYGEEDSDDE